MEVGSGGGKRACEVTEVGGSQGEPCLQEESLSGERVLITLLPPPVLPEEQLDGFVLFDLCLPSRCSGNPGPELRK